MSKVSFDLNDLYRTLKKHDHDILKHFEDNNLNDKDYLFYAINSDIVSNSLSIVMNMLFNNEMSVGIDNNARAVIEGFTILKMLGSGDISPEQMKIFRNHYAIVDYKNFKKVISESNHPVVQEIKQRYNDALAVMIDYYKCSKARLKNAKPSYSDPLFYLKKRVDNRIDFFELMEKYPLYKDDTFKMYRFFSIMAHPRFLLSKELEEGVRNVRHGFILMLLDYLIRYFEEGKLLVVDNKLPTFSDDFTNNADLSNNVKNIQTVMASFDILEKELCQFEKGYDGFRLYYFETVKHLLTDMLICETLGLDEHVVSKFKSFVEYSSVQIIIDHSKSLDEYRTLKLMYNCTSILQLQEHLKAMGLGEKDASSDILIECFSKYYQPKYGLKSFEEFENNIRNNSLYFLNPLNGKKSYNRVVKDSIAMQFTTGNFKDEYYDLFKLSNDMNHSSGYNFNSSPGIAKFSAHFVMQAVFKSMINYCLMTSHALQSNGINPNINVVIELFKIFIDCEGETMKSIAEDYNNKYHGMDNK